MWANEVACNTTDTSTCDDTLSTAGIHPWHTTGVAQLRQTFVTKLMGEADCDVFVCAARAHCEQTDSLATRCDHLARNLNRLSPAHFILLAFLSLLFAVPVGLATSRPLLAAAGLWTAGL